MMTDKFNNRTTIHYMNKERWQEKKKGEGKAFSQGGKNRYKELCHK